MKKGDGKERFLHAGFEAGILLKAIDGVLEVAGGVLLLFIKPVLLNRIIVALTQHELAEDPDDVWAGFLIHLAQKYTTDMQLFGTLYLFSHGVVKLIIIFLLYEKKLWSYPLSIAFLVMFIVFQILRYFHSYSIWLLVITGFDIVMIWLTWSEYQRLQQTNSF